MDEIKLDLLSLENEVNSLDEEMTKNIRRDLTFLRKDIETLEDNLIEMKYQWKFLRDSYEELEDVMELF